MLTGEAIGQALSCEIKKFEVLMFLSETENKISAGVKGEPHLNLAQSETLCMWKSPLYGTWEISSTPVKHRGKFMKGRPAR